MADALTYDLAEAAECIGGISEKWLAAQLRAGKLPGRKVGRKWRMTASDIEAALDIFKVAPQSTRRGGTEVQDVRVTGLTRTSRRRIAS